MLQAFCRTPRSHNFRDGRHKVSGILSSGMAGMACGCKAGGAQEMQPFAHGKDGLPGRKGLNLSSLWRAPASSVGVIVSASCVKQDCRVPRSCRLLWVALASAGLPHDSSYFAAPIYCTVEWGFADSSESNRCAAKCASRRVSNVGE